MNRRTALSLLVSLGVLPLPAFALDAEVRNRKVLPPQRSQLPNGDPYAMLLVIGDWGAGGRLQHRVAKGMSAVALRNGIHGVISTGDNIYPSGVESASDPQWQSKFENVYDLPGLNVKWYAVLGNHDYRLNPDAQIAYGKKNPQWVMPARYYEQEIFVSPETKVSVFALDTQSIMQRSGDWKKQLRWFASATERCNANVILVNGHHPMRSYGHYGDQQWLINAIGPAMTSAKVTAYLCGHDHDLQVIRHPDDAFHCIVSGTGGGARSTEWGKHTLVAHTNGGFAAIVCSNTAVEAHAYNADGELLWAGSLGRKR